jgi:hypothetical protein
MTAGRFAAVALVALVFVPFVPAAPGAKDKNPIPPGVWTVTYHPNRAVRAYTVTADGDVSFSESTTKAKLTVKDREVTLDFDDGKLERWTVGHDGRLFVEHFNPRANYPDGQPDQIGIGVLKAEGK